MYSTDVFTGSREMGSVSPCFVSVPMATWYSYFFQLMSNPLAGFHLVPSLVL